MLFAFIETLISVVVGYFFIEFVLRMIKPDENSETQQLLDEFDEAIVLCEVEQIQDVFYLYNAQDKNFIGQARTSNEITAIGERIQKHLMVVDGEEDAVNNLKGMLGEVRS